MRMYTLILSFLFILPFCSSFSVPSKPKIESVETQMIQDLEAAKYSILIKYAPANWKNELFGWNLNKAFETAKARILKEKPKTSNEYQKIFTQFLASTKDYHVHPIYYSTSWSMFPMQVRGVNGHYYFTSIDAKMSLTGEEVFFIADFAEEELKLLAANFPGITPGDEIIAIDGKPVKKIIEQLIDENFNGDRSPTGYALAERNLFLHRGKLGQKVPKGTFEITLKHPGDIKTFTRKLPWVHVPEWIPNHILKNQASVESDFAANMVIDTSTLENTMYTVQKLIEKDFSVGIAKEMAPKSFSDMIKELKSSFSAAEQDNEENHDNREKGFLPPLGKVLWETDINNEIYAYLYLHPSGKKVGYLFLSTFDESGANADKIMDEIIDIMKRFNTSADALVFDITNNTGGNLTFMYAVLSVLTNKPLKVPSHSELLIQEDVLRAAVLYNMLSHVSPDDLNKSEKQETLSGYCFDAKVLKQILSYASNLMKVWESGDRMTEPHYLFGIDEVMPHPKVQFTKPIMVLTNEYNFSCADFFPAILQDNKRATIFGRKTAGAGGYVRGYPYLSRFGVKGFTLTASIAYRLNGDPLENIGVTPDNPYEITTNDLQKNYVDYVQKVNNTIHRMMK